MKWEEANALYDELYAARLPGEVVSLASNAPFEVMYRVSYDAERYIVESLDEMLELREEFYTPPEENKVLVEGGVGPYASKFNRGSDSWERNVMKERYKKRNERLDKLPPQQKEQMGRFMNKLGVNKTAPSHFTSPIKEKKRDD